MDQATLVGPDIATGEAVLAVLDEAGIVCNVALLMLDPDYEDWVLTLSSPDFDQASSRHAYEQVVEALHGRFHYTLPQIVILPQRDAFIREMRRRFARAVDVRGMRLGGQTIGNRSVSNAYVYRVR